jgi:hypothetical protein
VHYWFPAWSLDQQTVSFHLEALNMVDLTDLAVNQQAQGHSQETASVGFPVPASDPACIQLAFHQYHFDDDPLTTYNVPSIQ